MKNYTYIVLVPGSERKNLIFCFVYVAVFWSWAYAAAVKKAVVAALALSKVILIELWECKVCRIIYCCKYVDHSHVKI